MGKIVISQINNKTFISKMNKVEINDKIYTYPENWDEVSFGLWEDFQMALDAKLDSEDKYSYDTMIDIMSLITGISRQDFLQQSKQFFEMVFSTVKFIFDDSLSQIKMNNEIEIAGEKYVIDDNPNISFGQWIDRDAVLEAYPVNQKLSAMLAVMLIPVKNEGKYNSDEVEKRQAEIKKMCVKDVYPLLAFFLTKKKLLLACLEAYSTGVEVLHHRIQELETFLKNGGGSTSFLSWRRKILQKWMPYLREEYSKSFNTLHTLMTRVSQQTIN